MKKTQYICRYLRFAYLLKILFRQSRSEITETTIFYLKPNGISSLLKKTRWLKGLILHGVNIEPLKYNLAKLSETVRYSIRREAHIKALSDIINRVDREMLQTEISLFNFFGKKLAPVKDNIRSYMKQEIGLEIMDDLLLVEIVACLPKQESSIFYEGHPVLFIDRKSYWARLVCDYAGKKGVSFITAGKMISKSNKTLRCGSYLFLLVAEIFLSIFRKKNEKIQNSLKKIGIPYYFHKNFTEFDHQRNYYLFWYPQTTIDPARILIYADGTMDIPPEEKERIEKAGFSLVSCNGILKKRPDPTVVRHKCSWHVITMGLQYLWKWLRLLFYVRDRFTFEQWKILAVLFIRLPYWEDFFRSNNIKIKFRFHPHFSHRDIAADLAQAAIISYQYANYSPEGFSALQEDFCDVYFVWGEFHQRHLMNSASNIKNIVCIGYVFDHIFDKVEKEVSDIKKKFAEKNACFIIAMLSESMVGPFRERVLSLFRMAFELAFNDPDIGIVIKPKTSDLREVLRSSPKTAEVFSHLEDEGRVEILDNRRYPVEAGKASDLVVGVYAGSTAALECALSGVPSIVYECSLENHDYSLEKRDYKNKIIFDDLQKMIDAIKGYKFNRKRSDGFADWTDILDQKDSFRDGQANKRMGFYIENLFQKMEIGLNKETAIKETNGDYMKHFGKEVTKCFVEEKTASCAY